MKHGDKEKGKASKASGKKASAKEAGRKEAGGKGSKASPVQSKDAGASEKASPKTSSKVAAPSGRPPARVENGGFSNAVVGNAFKRAIKKYPTAFKRLSD